MKLTALMSNKFYRKQCYIDLIKKMSNMDQCNVK